MCIVPNSVLWVSARFREIPRPFARILEYYERWKLKMTKEKKNEIIAQYA